MKSDLNSQTTLTPDIAPSHDFAQVDRVNSATKLTPCRVTLSSFWIMVVETSGRDNSNSISRGSLSSMRRSICSRAITLLGTGAFYECAVFPDGWSYSSPDAQATTRRAHLTYTPVRRCYPRAVRLESTYRGSGEIQRNRSIGTSAMDQEPTLGARRC